MPGLDLTPEEINELAKAAFRTFWRGTAMEDAYGGEPDKSVWHDIARAVLRKHREMYLAELARALQDSDNAAKLREELRDLRCPHCGKRLEDEPEERDRRG